MYEYSSPPPNYPGAALATMTGAMIKDAVDPSVNVVVTTYGLPRGGNRAWADFLDSDVSHPVTLTPRRIYSPHTRLVSLSSRTRTIPSRLFLPLFSGSRTRAGRSTSSTAPRRTSSRVPDRTTSTAQREIPSSMPPWPTIWVSAIYAFRLASSSC